MSTTAERMMTRLIKSLNEAFGSEVRAAARTGRPAEGITIGSSGGMVITVGNKVAEIDGDGILVSTRETAGIKCTGHIVDFDGQCEYRAFDNGTVTCSDGKKVTSYTGAEAQRVWNEALRELYPPAGDAEAGVQCSQCRGFVVFDEARVRDDKYLCPGCDDALQMEGVKAQHESLREAFGVK